MTERLDKGAASSEAEPLDPETGIIRFPDRGILPYNLSVSLSLDSSPSRGASGEEEKPSSLPKPPLLGEVASRRDDGEAEQSSCFV